MTDPKPIPAGLLDEVRRVESAMESAAKVHADALKVLGQQQQDLIEKLCAYENLNRKEHQLALLVDRGEYVILKDFTDWEQIASELMQDVDRQEHSNIVAMCYAFSLFVQEGVEMPDAARELLMKKAEVLKPEVQERLKAYIYS